MTISSKDIFYTTALIRVMAHGVGTSFFFKYTHENKEYLFLVSNRHVVQSKIFNNSSNKPIICLGYGKNNQPSHYFSDMLEFDIKKWNKMWYVHQDKKIDIAVYPISCDPYVKLDEYYYTVIDKEMIPDEQERKKLEFIEPIKFVGYPNGLYDMQNYMPIARHGITATPLQFDYEDEPKFLIDASVYRGSSGSPVFIHERISTPQKYYFVGILSREFCIENNIMNQNEVLTLESKERLDIGAVIKAEMIIETIKGCLKSHFLIS